MEIKEPVKTKTFIDYDFVYTSGYKMPVSIDEAAGDKITNFTDRYEISLVERPSAYKADETLPEEHVTIFKSALAAVTRVQRTMVLPTTEEKLAFQKFIHEQVTGVQ